MFAQKETVFAVVALAQLHIGCRFPNVRRIDMKWIKCNEKIPQNGSHVIVTDGKTVIGAMRLDNGWLIPPFMAEVSHWMEFPRFPIAHPPCEYCGNPGDERWTFSCRACDKCWDNRYDRVD